MKLFLLILLILLLVLLRLLNDIKEKWAPPSKSWVTSSLANCNDTDQTFKGVNEYKLGDGLETVGCGFANTFVSIGKTFENTFDALDNTINLGVDIVNIV